MATLSTLITRVQELLSLAGGLGVQTYAQPKIVQFIQMAYTDLADRRFWNDYTQTVTYTLDGSTGKVTTDLTNIIKSFRDIQYVWYGDYASPLPRAPNNRAPDIIRQLSFTSSGDPACPFKIMPVDNTGEVHVRYRSKATVPFTELDNVPMDEELLIRYAALLYLSFDNTNQAAITIINKMYVERLNELEKLENNHSKNLYSSSNQTVTEWHDA
jgi:hypothetical protein